MSKTHEDHGVASREGSEVILDGPGPVAASMTPEAARKTGESLLVAAGDAAEDGEADTPPRQGGEG